VINEARNAFLAAVDKYTLADIVNGWPLKKLT